jgi:hypothetical protein
MTRLDSTIDVYKVTAERLITKFYTATGRDWTLNPEPMAIWLGQYKENISNATWRLYRATFRYMVEERCPEYLKSILKILDEYSFSVQSRSSDKKRLKKISSDVWEKLLAKYKTSKSSWLALAVFILKASSATGLRPNEWHGTVVINNILSVPNSKHTNGRSFASFRHLDISEVDKETQDAIFFLIEEANRVTRKEWMTHLKFARQALSIAGKNIGVEGLNLYSARHQAASNAKKAKVSKEELAAILGHASVHSSSYYGRASSGSSGGHRVTSTPEDVQKVHSKADVKTRMMNKIRR